MTKEEYWLALLEKNPKLANPDHKIQISSSNLRKMLEDSWEKGKDHQRKNGFEDIVSALKDMRGNK